MDGAKFGDFLGYKPSLTVDVTADLVHDDVPRSVTSTSPQTAPTPHVSTNIFVAGIPSSWDEEVLRNKYKEFGEVISTKVVKNRHFGFVMFKRPECAHAAINATHLTQPMANCPTLLHVSMAMHDEGADDEPNKRLFIRGLPQWANKEHLRQMFSPYGVINDCAVLMNPLGQCKGSGFVEFATLDEATAAVKDQASIRVFGWPEALEVKYSESAEVRQMRQERNRNRQKNWSTSPKYRGGTTPGSLNSPYPSFPPPLSVIPSPQGMPMMSPMPFSVVYTPHTPPSTSAPPTQIVYPQPVFHTMSPFYASAPLPVANPLPQKGDMHFSGGPITEGLIRMLVQPFGDIEGLKMVDGESAAIVRMTDKNQHAAVVQQLNGTIFSSGQLLAAGIYA